MKHVGLVHLTDILRRYKEDMMFIQVNPLMLQSLVYDMLDDLEFTQDSLYNDEASVKIKNYCQDKRQQYLDRLKKILNDNEMR